MRKVVLVSILAVVMMIAGIARAAEEEEFAPLAGGWKINREESPLGDRVHILTYLDSAKGDMTFVIACRNAETHAYLRTKNRSSALSDQKVFLEYKVDEDPIKKINMLWGSGSLAFFAKPIEFVKEMRGVKRFGVRLNMANTISEGLFDLTGIEEAESEVAKACKWDEQKPAGKPKKK